MRNAPPNAADVPTSSAGPNSGTSARTRTTSNPAMTAAAANTSRIGRYAATTYAPMSMTSGKGPDLLPASIHATTPPPVRTKQAPRIHAGFDSSRGATRAIAEVDVTLRTYRSTSTGASAPRLSRCTSPGVVRAAAPARQLTHEMQFG